jgi:hypothetical protein
MHNAALLRSYNFGDQLFRDAAWVIYLTLYIALRDQTPITIPTLRAANRLSETEVGEGLTFLKQAALLTIDDVSQRVTLTGSGQDRLEAYLRRFAKH